MVKNLFCFRRVFLGRVSHLILFLVQIDASSLQACPIELNDLRSSASQANFKSLPQVVHHLLQPGERCKATVEGIPGPYELISITEEFQGEKATNYFTPEQKKATLVSICNGIFKDSEGNLINTKGKKNFVMDQVGNFYIEGHLHGFHSSFLSGAPVAMAGEIEVLNGKIIFMSSESGHYAPPQNCIFQSVLELRKKGVHYPFGILDRGEVVKRLQENIAVKSIIETLTEIKNALPNGVSCEGIESPDWPKLEVIARSVSYFGLALKIVYPNALCLPQVKRENPLIQLISEEQIMEMKNFAEKNGLSLEIDYFSPLESWSFLINFQDPTFQLDPSELNKFK